VADSDSTDEHEDASDSASASESESENASEPEPAPASESAPASASEPESEESGRPELPRAALISERPRFIDTRAGRALEVAAVVIIALAVLIPGIWRYTLVDPWETHYSEVGRRMLQDDDLVHTQWQNEGFRSKPVLTMWMIAAGIRLTGHGAHGGYSGEMVSSRWILVGARMPFVLFGVLGLVLTWWMLARAVRRRVAWLAFLIIATCPFYFFIARQAITDMPLVGSLMGAMACFIMALHAGDERLEPIWGRINAYHLFLAVTGLFVGWQVIYYASYFYRSPGLANGIRFPSPHIVLPLIMVLTSALFVSFSPLFRLITNLFRRNKGDAPRLAAPTRSKRQVYFYWFYTLLGVSVLAKGLPGIGIAGATCLFYVILTNSWKQLWDYEIPRGVILVILIVVPWHFAMYLKDGRPFVRDYIITHNLRRATAGVHGERGTFDFFMGQLGIGMWPWVAALPAAVGRVFTSLRPNTREGRARLVIGIWAVVAVALFSLSQTKFHHYIFPAVPALGMLIAFWLDDLLDGRVRRSGILLFAGSLIVLLVMMDLMGEQKQFIEMFVYRYDRPWPQGIDLSGTIFAFGLIFAVVFPLLSIRVIRPIVVGLIAVFTLSFAYWGMNDYMKPAATNWGMRGEIQHYYRARHIYGLDIRYYGLRQLADEWNGSSGTRRVQSFIPDDFATGQKMSIHIDLLPDGRTVSQSIVLNGSCTDFGDHWFDITLDPGELSKIERLVERGKTQPEPWHRAWHQVRADRLIAWQLYWRGENFWSGDEIWAESPDTKTAFKDTDNREFLKYLKDPSRAGQRFFLMTESGRAAGLQHILPTQHAKDTFEILDTSSNKFTLLTFTL